MAEEWKDLEHAFAYLRRADGIPHRAEGEAVLLEEVPRDAERVLDLGTGDGRLLALVLLRAPAARGVGLDFSPAMLEKARSRFAGADSVEIVEHDLDGPLPSLGSFDAAVSSFAIHHLSHRRKRSLYCEVFALLRPGGAFLNLEHVSSPTDRLHEKFLEDLGISREEEDRSNILLDFETQLRWLREIGFAEVDCLWKWRELALLGGRKGR